MHIILDKNFPHSEFGAFSIYFEKEKRFFPSEDWDDFMVSIIIDWYAETNKHNQFNESEFDLLFMDGAYYLHVTKTNNNCKITGLKEGTEGDKSFSEITRYDVFLQTLFELATHILNNCDNIGEYDKKLLVQLLSS